MQDGSARYPWLIRTVEDLNSLALFVNASKENANSTKGQHFRLMNDIDLTDFLKHKPEGWQPIGMGLDIFANERHSFQGYFHGGGHVISGLRTNRFKENSNKVEHFFTGLFGIIENATIDSLGVEVAENDSVVGTNLTGILAGQVYWNCTIRECYAKGKVVGQLHVGGLVGFLSGSLIENCYTVAQVHGMSEFKGGLVGHVYWGGTIKYSYASGYVEGWSGVGGLVGYMRHQSPVIQNCFVAKSRLNGVEKIGKIVGDIFDATTPTVSHCYINHDVFLGGNGGYHDGIEKNSKQFKDVGFFINPNNWTGGAWNFYEVWVMASNDVHPILRWQKEYTPPAPCLAWDNVVRMRWNNTLTVINNPILLEEHVFNMNAVIWYRDSIEIGRGQSWSAGADGRVIPTGRYHIVFSENLSTCEQKYLSVQTISHIAAFPNPIYSGQTLYIETTEEVDDLNHAVIEIYNIQGRLIETINISAGMITNARSADLQPVSRIPIDIKYSQGYYVIVLRDQNHNRKEVKIVVK
jgi:hypothetical protein